MKNTVSFDFDGTLNTIQGCSVCQELLKNNFNVIVTTSRFNDNHPHYHPANVNNNDLWQAIELIPLPKRSVTFLNGLDWKYEILKDNKDLICHIDDDNMEVLHLNNNGIKAINIKDKDWIEQLMQLCMQCRVNENNNKSIDNQ